MNDYAPAFRLGHERRDDQGLAFGDLDHDSVFAHPLIETTSPPTPIGASLAFAKLPYGVAPPTRLPGPVDAVDVIIDGRAYPIAPLFAVRVLTPEGFRYQIAVEVVEGAAVIRAWSVEYVTDAARDNPDLALAQRKSRMKRWVERGMRLIVELDWVPTETGSWTVKDPSRPTRRRGRPGRKLNEALLDQMASIIDMEPDISIRELADRLGRAPSTVHGWRQELDRRRAAGDDASGGQS